MGALNLQHLKVKDQYMKNKDFKKQDWKMTDQIEWLENAWEITSINQC